jgi:hypothetical protein
MLRQLNDTNSTDYETGCLFVHVSTKARTISNQRNLINFFRTLSCCSSGVLCSLRRLHIFIFESILHPDPTSLILQKGILSLRRGHRGKSDTEEKQ